ncbi:MAG: CysS/YqeB C-terminal domain-containing protein, partial [Vulcanimicrobiaceae bacterium]
DFFDRLRIALRAAQGDAAARVELDGADAEEAIARVIAARMQARATKNWAESDRLRDALARCGVVLEDSKEGTTWTIAV